MKDPLSSLRFGMEREVLDSRILWSAWDAVFITTRCRYTSRFVTFALRGLGLIGIHEVIQEVEVPQLFPSVCVIGNLALCKHNTGTVNIKRHFFMTIIL